MSRRTLGIAMIITGAVLIVAGAFALAGAAPTPEPTDSAAPATTAAPGTTTTPTTLAPAETATPTTTSTTTTTAATTTTTTAPPPSIEDFAADYATATEADDVDFLFDHLYPAVRDAFGADVCRNWVETEIVAISGYRITGDITGPVATTLSVAGTSIQVEQYYSAPISFTFQGQSFDGQATWVAEDGHVYWAGECR